MEKVIFSNKSFYNSRDIMDYLEKNIGELEGTIKNEEEKFIYDFLKKNKKLPFDLNPQEIVHLEKTNLKFWMEYISFRYKFKKNPEEKKLTHFPLYVLIEPVSTCNLRCTMCFQVDKTFTRKPYMGLMDINFYKKIIDECEENGTKAITLASRGEPTLHPKLPEMLEYAKDKFLELKLNTNATKLNEKLIRAILKSNVNELTYSVDESEKEKFEKIRVNANFDEVVSNIKLFNKIRKEEFPNSITTTRISGVLVNERQDQERITNFWSQIVDHVVFVKCQLRWDTYNNDKEKIDTPCNFFWERFYIWFDGITNPCDVDYKSFLSPGKLEYGKNSIKEIWHSKELNKLRNEHLSGNRSKIKPCDRCGLDF